LNERSTIRLSQRLITAAVLVALSGILAACADQVGNFDPTDMLDWMDSKKKLPGDRKPVFPDGVPGLEQGVPKQLYKGTAEQQQIDQQNAQAAAAAAPPAEEPKSKGKKSKAKQPAAAPAAEADAPGEADGAAAAVPADPKPKKIVRKRTTAPPPDQPAGQAAQPAQPSQPSQQSAAPFPAPLPGASATR
jgi:hypothetical protein